jgi:hypothetical protein
MNYIHELERENATLKARLKAKDDAAVAFMVFLRSPKFTGEENGERKDWICTTDVFRWLIETNTASIVAEEQTAANWKPRFQESDQCIAKRVVAMASLGQLRAA